ncbi:MAG: procyclic acidic repetitive family protein [Chloroflexota bacterium]|nr:procyclic acidic repetitive family protein [Chloroflexota bacterium]
MRKALAVPLLVSFMITTFAVVLAGPSYEEWADRNGNGVIDKEDKRIALDYYNTSMGATEHTPTPEPTNTSEPTATVEPTVELTSTPEPTNTSEPTATAEPTVEPTSTTQPTNTPEPSGSLSLCEEHNPTLWHALISEDDSCHYDHEHKDDPNRVNDVFGEPGAWFGSPGQSISYPWQTYKVMADGTVHLENDAKHEVYGWQVRKDMPCKGIAHSIACVTDFRTTYHMNSASAGAVVRFHSFSMEARACLLSDQTKCGTIRSGGWMDFGHLEVDKVYVPLAGDPATLQWFERQHNSNRGGYVTWYGRHPFGEFSALTADSWGKTDPNDPHALHLDCPDYQCAANGSTMFADNLSFNIWLSDPDGDGLINFDGYADRYGNIVEGCTEAGVDCVPIQLENWPQGFILYRDDAHGMGMREYDTSPEGEWWIEYPN